MSKELITTEKIEWIKIGEGCVASKEWCDYVTKLLDEALKALGDAIQKQIEEQEHNDK